MDKPLAIVGDQDLVIGFKALGFKVYPVKGPQESGTVLDEVAREEAAVCLVQDNIYQAQENKINSYKDLPLPIFIPFAKDAKTDLLEQIIKEIRLRAIGTF